MRRSLLWKKLDKEGWKIPPLPKGYITLRDARLGDSARDLLETWIKGDYDYDTIVEGLRKLERPIAGSGGRTRVIGWVGYQGEAQDGGSGILANGPAQNGEEEVLTFMQQSLFCTPESFDDDILEEWVDYWEDPEIMGLR